MPANSSVPDQGSAIRTLAWDLTLHRALSLSIAVSGTITNLVAIIVIISRKLYQQKSFTFVLNFFVGNLLMSSIALPLHFSLSFSSLQNMNTRCPISGYAYFSLTANSLMDIFLVSLNRYIQIVRFNHYDKIFSTRNTWLMLMFAWLFFPTVLMFPITGAWGNFRFDPLRHICNPLIANKELRKLLLSLIISVTAPISFCYIGIIWKARSSGKRVNTTLSGDAERMKNERQLIRSVLVLITLSSTMHVPFIVSIEVDPNMNMISPWFHCFSFYLGSSYCLVNGLSESLLNQQINKSFLSISKRILKRNRRKTSEIPDTAVAAIS